MLGTKKPDAVLPNVPEPMVIWRFDGRRQAFTVRSCGSYLAWQTHRFCEGEAEARLVALNLAEHGGPQ